MTTYEKQTIKNFQDWVADSYHDNLIVDQTNEDILKTYLEIIGDIIAGSGITLAKIVDDAKTGKFNPAY